MGEPGVLRDRMKGGELLVKALAEKKIPVVFSLCGGFINPVYEALMDYGLRLVTTRHEQEAGHMADAWTRITRQPAVCLVGPEGFANSVPAMAEAFLESSPTIFITSSSIFRRIERGGFKEIPHYKVAEPITKYSTLVNVGSRIPEFIDRAFDIAVNGKPGPVHVSIPVDMLYASYETNMEARERPVNLSRRRAHRARPNPDDVAEVAAMLEASARPVIVAGHGVWWANAEGELERVALQLGIPVFNVPFHKKVLDTDSKVYCGLADIHQYPPSKAALEEADVILLLGCRLDNLLNFGNPPLFHESATLVTVNASPEEVVENHIADLRILGDPKLVLAELASLARSKRLMVEPEWLERNAASRSEWVRRTKATLDASPKAPLHPLRLCVEVLNALTDHDYLAMDGGDIWSWCEIALNLVGWEGRRLRGVLQPGPFGLIGTGVPFATATKLAIGDEGRVVLITGDGAFGAGGLSIETAIHHGVPIIVVIANDAGFGMIREQQRVLFRSGKTFGTSLREDVRYDGVVKCLGGYGEFVETEDQLRPALKRAFASGQPACVNVRTATCISPLTEGLLDRRSKASIE